MRWTRARSRALASNHGPANQGSGHPERARAGAGRPHEEHGALLRPIGRADAVRPIVAGTRLGPDRRPPSEHESTFMLPRRSRRQRSTHGSNASGAALPTPRLIAGSRLLRGYSSDRAAFATLRPRDRRSTHRFGSQGSGDGHPSARHGRRGFARSVRRRGARIDGKIAE